MDITYCHILPYLRAMVKAKWSANMTRCVPRFDIACSWVPENYTTKLLLGFDPHLFIIEGPIAGIDEAFQRSSTRFVWSTNANQTRNLNTKTTNKGLTIDLKTHAKTPPALPTCRVDVRMHPDKWQNSLIASDATCNTKLRNHHWSTIVTWSTVVLLTNNMAQTMVIV